MRNRYIFIFALFALCVPYAAFAASFELRPPFSPAVVGDIVRVPIYINVENELAVIGSAHVQFPRELLWARSFTAAPGWFSVPAPEYNSINNARGIVRASAGFEEGVTGHTLFGTLEFVAVGQGQGGIRITGDSMALDARNENIFADVDARVGIEVLAPEGDSHLPPQLFDIGLQLERHVFSPGEPMTLRATFQSFGTVPTPVDMFFTVTDESGKIFAISEESLVVETDAVFTKRFEHLDLPPGAYEMHMSTRYNVDVEDDFQVSFSVRSRIPSGWILGFVLVLTISILALFISNRKKQKHGTK